jgi:hypothetical protein
MTIKRNGGLVFWRIGKLGGSFYWAAPRDPHAKMIDRAHRINRRKDLQLQAWLWRHTQPMRQRFYATQYDRG